MPVLSNLADTLTNKLNDPAVLDFILSTLVIRDAHQTTENLSALRRQIDECDNDLLELLAKRMRVSE